MERKYLYALIALFVVPISGLAIDIYVPSLPAVSHYFHVDKAFSQLTITTYMIGLGFSQLFAGGISDSFGRRKPFLVGITIFTLATLLIPMSSNIYQLLALRFVQGATVAATVVPMRSVILDLFEGPELHKMMTYMTMAWSIGPIIAPAIGGYLQHYAGWQSSFYFLAIYSSIALVFAFFYLRETSQHQHPFLLSHMIFRYRAMLLNHQYTAGVLIDGLVYSLFILFSVVSPFLIQVVLHFTAIQFGHIALCMGFAWFIGTMTNRLLIHHNLKNKIRVCLWLMLIVIVSMCLMAMFLPMTIYTIVVPMLLLLWFGGIIFPNYFTSSILLFPMMTGSANALFGSSVFLMTAMSSALGALLRSNSALPLALTYLFFISICLVVFYTDSRNKDKKFVQR